MLNHFLKYLLIFVFSFNFCIFPIVSYGKYLENTKASNSEVNRPIWLKFELIWDFMPFLNFCKFHEDPISNEWHKPRTAISMMDTTHLDGHYNTILEAL